MRGFTSLFSLTVLAAGLVLPVLTRTVSEGEVVEDAFAGLTENTLDLLGVTLDSADASDPPKKSKGKPNRGPPRGQPGPSTSRAGGSRPGPTTSGGVPQTALNFAKWITDHPEIVNEKSVCFYTGGNGRDANDQKTHIAMPEFAAREGNCNWTQTLRTKAKATNTVGWDGPGWDLASETLAKTVANHPVRVLFGEHKDDNSVWKRKEEPQLQEGLRSGRVRVVEFYMWTKKPVAPGAKPQKGNEYEFHLTGHM